MCELSKRSRIRYQNSHFHTHFHSFCDVAEIQHVSCLASRSLSFRVLMTVHSYKTINCLISFHLQSYELPYCLRSAYAALHQLGRHSSEMAILVTNSWPFWQFTHSKVILLSTKSWEQKHKHRFSTRYVNTHVSTRYVNTYGSAHDGQHIHAAHTLSWLAAS